jgi:polar amino acid transport system substrate-binding protein
MHTDLASGRLTYAADSFGSASYANKQRGNPWKFVVPEPDERVGSSVKAAQACFPMAKGTTELAKAVNEDLESLRKDGTIANPLEQNGLDRSAAEVGELR